MRLIYIILSCCLLASVGCNNSDTGNQNSTTDSTKTQPKTAKAPVQSKLSPDGTNKLMTLISKYYALKNALVATKAGRSDSAAAELAVAADSMQVFLQKDNTSAGSLKIYIDTIVTQSKLIPTIKDETCEKQRTAFAPISSSLYSILKNVDVKNAGVYYQHCPMAMNEKGAFWLSDESEIKNPYYGKKMLDCGEVTDSL